MAKKTARTAIESLETRTMMSNTWYVANGGSDAAAGNLQSPFATIQAALNHASSGDTVMLRGGNYAGGFKITTPHLTLRSAPGETAHISSPNNNSSIEVAVRIGEDAHYTTLANLDISGGYYYAVKTESTWDTGAPNPHGPSHLTIQNSTLHDSGADVIKLTPKTDYSRILNNEIYNSGRTNPGNAEGIDAVQANYALVRGNFVHDTTTNGIYYKGGSLNTMIAKNRVTRTGHSGILLGQSADENWFDTSVNPNYYESINGTIRNNIVWDTQGAGVGAWAAQNAKIYNNTLVNVAQTMFGGILVQGQEHWIPNDTVVPSRDVSIYNNVVAVSGNRPVLEIREGGLVGSLYTASNAYFHDGKPIKISDARTGYVGGLGGWKAAGNDAGSFKADPRLGNDGYFTPNASSPLINAGVKVGMRADFNGTARTLGSTTDIGAHELA